MASRLILESRIFNESKRETMMMYMTIMHKNGDHREPKEGEIVIIKEDDVLEAVGSLER